MFLIASGAYINQEMRPEFGSIPPVFLPLGNRRLLDFQIDLIQKTFPEEKIFLSIPDDFRPSEKHNKLSGDSGIAALASVGVRGGEDTGKISKMNLIMSPLGISLPDAWLYAINVADCDDDFVRILNGDTLFSSLPRKLDVLTVETEFKNYDWDFVDSEKRQALTGYFSFKSKKDLIRSLTLSRGDLIKALSLYGKFNPLSFESPGTWFDLGHLNSYFESRAKITTERAFNSIFFERGALWKTGKPTTKIKAEAKWYENIPAPLRVNLPQYLGVRKKGNKIWYGVEYLPYIPLNELYVHGNQNLDFWMNILDKLKSILASFKCNQYINHHIDIEKFSQTMYVQKTYDRVKKIYRHPKLRLLYDQLCFDSIIDDCIQRTLSTIGMPCVLHGDFCFSNMLFSARGNRIKLIDPRGLDGNGSQSIYGDQKYDIAKLAHSIIGLYDYVIAGKHQLEGHTIKFFLEKDIEIFRKRFLNEKINDVPIMECMPIVVLLFVSMIPLHEDRIDRQIAFLLNAKFLYEEYVK